MEKLILYIVKNLVSKPDSASIECKLEEKSTVLTIKLHKRDVGKIIGKNGKVIKAIRTVVRTILPKGTKVFIRVGE